MNQFIEKQPPEASLSVPVPAPVLNTAEIRRKTNHAGDGASHDMYETQQRPPDEFHLDGMSYLMCLSTHHTALWLPILRKMNSPTFHQLQLWNVSGKRAVVTYQKPSSEDKQSTRPFKYQESIGAP